VTRRRCCCSPAPCCTEDIGAIGFVGKVPIALRSDCCCQYTAFEDVGTTNPLDLGEYDALFSHVGVGACSSWRWPFVAADAALITTWVSNGGRLFLFDEYFECRQAFNAAEYAEFNTLWTTISGTSVNDDTILGGCVNYIATNPDLLDMPQPDIAMGAACTINHGAATIIASDKPDDTTENVIVTGTAHGGGYVFCFGDTNIFGNDCSPIKNGYNCGLFRYLMKNSDPLN